MPHPSRLAFTLVASAALGAVASAQNDECATALPLAIGVTPFDTTAATLSLPAWPCAVNGGPDVWFRFTAPNTAQYTIDLCGSSYDTALEVFTGPCATLVSVACNDDYCGLQSGLTGLALNAGATLFVRIGGYSGLVGTGTVTVTELMPPPPPSGSIPAWLAEVASGTAASYVNSLLPGPIVDDIGLTNGANGVTYEFIVYGDNTGVSSGLMGARYTNVGSSGGLKFEQYPDSMQYGATEWGVADHYFTGPNTEHTDIQLVFVVDTVAGATELFVDGVSFGTVPYAPILQGDQGIGQIHDPINGSFDIMGLGLVRGVAVYEARLGLAEIMAHKNAYVTGSVGTRYCNPAVPNSTGQSGALAASGSAVVATNNLTLMASQLPLNSFGFFLTSRTQGTVVMPGGSQGTLCLSGSIGRYVGAGQIKNSGALGEFSLALNLTQHPTPTGLITVVPGDTWNFQAWHRDAVGGSATSNFTHGLRIVFN